jgi:peptidoglycan/LPS O-acetylase OafA/YrhL
MLNDDRESKLPTHLPGLDGVRGVAILAVLALHALDGAPHAGLVDGLVGRVGSAGWMGVDLFFVLSGFLITGILLEQRGKAGYFRTFYARRVLRIVPVYVAFLGFSLYVAPVVGASTEAAAVALRHWQAWYWTYLANVMLLLHPAAHTAYAPTHLWSLAIEEQFYLCWPLAVWLLSPRAIAKVALACIVGAELARIAVVMFGARGEVNYLLLPTRMDTLAVGAFLACAVRDPRILETVRKCQVPVALGAVMLLGVTVYLTHGIDPYQPLPQLYALPAVAALSGVLVLAATQPGTVFAWAPLRFLGRVSYGMYLWHVLVLSTLLAHTRWLAPRLVGGSYLVSDLASVAVLLTATVAVALVSWHLIEQPFLRLKRYVPYGGAQHARVVSSIGVNTGASIASHAESNAR